MPMEVRVFFLLFSPATKVSSHLVCILLLLLLLLLIIIILIIIIIIIIVRDICDFILEGSLAPLRTRVRALSVTPQVWFGSGFKQYVWNM